MHSLWEVFALKYPKREHEVMSDYLKRFYQFIGGTSAFRKELMEQRTALDKIWRHVQTGNIGWGAPEQVSNAVVLYVAKYKLNNHKVD